jgi:hypothetical protein
MRSQANHARARMGEASLAFPIPDQACQDSHRPEPAISNHLLVESRWIIRHGTARARKDGGGAGGIGVLFMIMEEVLQGMKTGGGLPWTFKQINIGPSPMSQSVVRSPQGNLPLRTLSSCPTTPNKVRSTYSIKPSRFGHAGTRSDGEQLGLNKLGMGDE